MVCDGTYGSHPWVSEKGRRQCPDCGLVDLAAARLRRDVLHALIERGLLTRIDDEPP